MSMGSRKGSIDGVGSSSSSVHSWRTETGSDSTGDTARAIRARNRKMLYVLIVFVWRFQSDFEQLNGDYLTRFPYLQFRPDIGIGTNYKANLFRTPSLINRTQIYIQNS